MKITADFGVVTACHAGDCFMVKGTCASIRHFMPDVPICVIVDGDHSIKELEDTYGVIPLPVNSCSDVRLRSICRGSSKSKWCALWEGPFEHMLYVDSDVVVWGDVRQGAAFKERDFVMMSPFTGSAENKGSIDHFFYSTGRIAGLFPDFDWVGKPFFCAGAFAMRRGLFPIEDLLELQALSQKYPDLFKFQDQGIFNFLVQRSIQAGGVDLAINELQYIAADHPRKETQARFGDSPWRLPVNVAEPALLHLCGEKPLLQNLSAYSAPFTAARLEHYKRFFHGDPLASIKSRFSIFREELCVLAFRARRKLRGAQNVEPAFAGGLLSDSAKNNAPRQREWRAPEITGKLSGEVEVVSDFGVVTACHKGDYFMAKAAIASIRHFMPEVPICVIVDGDFSIRELQDRYGVMAMRTDEIRHDRLREMCRRSTRSKLAAMWEGPFERYLWVDCDTVVMGDFAKAEPWAEADFWAMTTIEPGTVPDKNLRHFFLDPDELRQLDPGFDAHQYPLFCDGVYVARRGCLDLDRTYDMWKKSMEHTKLFSWTKCQGLTNYMVFSSQQRGELTVRVCDRQYIVPDHPRREAEERFGVHAKLPPHRWEHAEVVHFCGTKPLVQNSSAYNSLFTAFRLKHRRQAHSGPLSGLRAMAGVAAEESGAAFKRLRRKLREAR